MKQLPGLTAMAVSLGNLAGAGTAKLPNIVIIYADDMGYGDLSCYNPKAVYKTPRLDRMAEEGIRFADSHSPSTICSPSRYGLFSGQQIYRSTGRGGGAFEGPGGPSYLKPGTLTLGDMLQENLPNPGGKWRWDNDEGWMAPGYEFVKADLLFYEKMRNFITDHRKKSPEKPFCAVLCTQICHAPVLPAPEFNGTTNAGPRGDFVRELDTLVGRALDLLAELGIDEETLVLFNADNGPETMHVAWMREDHHHDPAGGWRGVKRDGWEGGHRVPFIARWPGRIPKSQVSGQMTNTTDIFATLASVVGYQLPDAAATDSFDMLPAMLGTRDPQQSIRPYLLTQSFQGEFQIRQGDWKYLDHKGSGGNSYSEGILKKYALPETEPEAPGQLFNLATDPGETTNLYFKEEEKRQQLQALLKKLKESGRSAPTGRVPIGIENIPRIEHSQTQRSRQVPPT